MAEASDSQPTTSQQPQDIPLQTGPAAENLGLQNPRRRQKGKGKGKEKEVESASPAHEGWSWVFLSDSYVSKLPPIFTRDGSYFFSVVGSSVKIHSVLTGQVVSTLYSPSYHNPQAEGLSDVISWATLNPHNAFQLITASLNGFIRIWDFLDATLLRTISIDKPILHICAHEKFKDHVFVSIVKPTRMKNSRGNETEHNAAVLRVSLKPQKATASSLIQKSAEIFTIGKTRLTTALAISPNGEWLVATAGHKAYVAMTSSLQSGFTKFVSPERLTTLAFHPSDEYFATGDDKGHIRLWYCLNEHITKINSVGVEKRAQTTTFHWHAHAVSSICFTANGAYIVSGGEESVAVIWQVHTGKREFVPRVGAPITTVAVNKTDTSEEYLLGLADASYVFIDSATLKISRGFSRIKLDTSGIYFGTSSFAPLAVHSSSSTVVIPSSHPSSLQTFSPSTSKLVAELEVSPSNKVSRRDEKPLQPSRVERAVISSSGEWMATIDSREGDEHFRAEVYLKIWWWDSQAGTWILNTRIDRPHGLRKVTAVTFSPIQDRHALQLATTGNDNNIKTWRIQTSKDKKGNVEEHWVPRSSFSFRSERPSHASWALDGSLLSVSLGPYVALYNPFTNSLYQALTSSACKMTTSAHFVGRGRYLVVVGGKDIILWDLVSQSVRWHHATNWTIDTVLPHPSEDVFAVFHNSFVAAESQRRPIKVTLFSPASPEPYLTHTLPFRFINLVWYQSPSSSLSSPSSFNFLGITESRNIVMCGNNVQPPNDEGGHSNALSVSGSASAPKRTLLQDIFGKSAVFDVQATPSISPAPIQMRTGKPSASIFSAPAYMTPSLESLFSPLMGTLLNPRPADDIEEDVEDAEPGENNDETEMNIDEGPTMAISQQKRVVDKQEMDAFTGLFSVYAVTRKNPRKIATHKQTHWKKINPPTSQAPQAQSLPLETRPQELQPAVSKQKPNGTTSAAHTPGVKLSTVNDSVSPNESTLVDAKRKKRKKSMD